MDEETLRRQLNSQPGPFAVGNWSSPQLGADQNSPSMAPPPTPLTITTSTIQGHPALQSPSSSAAATPRSATRARRGSARAASTSARPTRRRKTSISMKEDESDGSASEEFSMEGTKTKSGRRVHRPTQFNPAAKTPSRRRGPYRRNYDARTCKVCQRGHSPNSNMIVFCDGCNTPYHQLCHDPPIDDLVIAVESAEWFCHLCAKMRQQRPLTMGVSGQELTQEEKQAYLANLPLSSLVEIIFAAEKLHPDLPIYDPDTRNIVSTLERQAAMAKSRGLTASTGASTPDPTSDAPKWEDMIVRAISAIDPIAGVQPKFIFEWIGANFPALEGRDVRAEAQSSLQAALRKGVLLRDGHAYRVNPEWEQKELMKNQEQGQQRVPQAWGIAPIGKGVRLQAETEEGGDKWLVDDGESGAFSHQFQEVEVPTNGVGLGIGQVVSVP